MMRGWKDGKSEESRRGQKWVEVKEVKEVSRSEQNLKPMH